MALFGKKKEETGAMSPMPPAPPQVSNVPTSSAPVGNIPEPVKGIDSLSTPPVPGGSLVDIKAEVAQKPQVPGVPSQLPELPQVPGVSELESPVALGEDISLDSVQGLKTELDEDKILSDDSLFDFSELETQMANRSDESSGVSASVVEGGENGDFDVVEHKGAVTNNDLESLHFVNGSKRVVTPNETYFLTTKQFKSLLGIVEDVKIKVKDASEIHLKMLDIKAEEDIEYENLRKSFQFIEDKLYEVDNLIFEK